MFTVCVFLRYGRYKFTILKKNNFCSLRFSLVLLTQNEFPDVNHCCGYQMCEGEYRTCDLRTCAGHGSICSEAITNRCNCQPNYKFDNYTGTCIPPCECPTKPQKTTTPTLKTCKPKKCSDQS